MTGKEQHKVVFGLSFSQYAWKQFRRNKSAIISLYVLFALIFIAIFADFIANNQPLYAKYHGKTFYPAFQSFFQKAYTDSTKNPSTQKYETLQFDITDWRLLDLESVIWPIIPYSPNQPDRFNRDYAHPNGEQFLADKTGELQPAPTFFRHHLGTTKIGLDVFSGIIHATRISLKVGIVAMSIAGIIGVFLGALSGFYGDTKLQLSRGKYYTVWMGIIIGFFYAFVVRKYVLQDAINEIFFSAIQSIFTSLLIWIFVIFISGLVGNLFGKIPYLDRKIYAPVDAIISRMIEILDSLPKLLIIITIAALFHEKSIYLVMAVIGLTSWTGIARFTRAEFLKNRNLNYTEAARALGLSPYRIMLKHILPNASGPIYVSLAFGIASAILAETSLSFLGIGVPDDVVTWGSLLAAGRQQFDAWWLVVFPGLAIFITVTVYNLIGEGLRDAFDPKLKR
ncbi:MAG: ABC transporter permease [Sphingobacteriales bacterium]|nr:MAG: ABC transporter permease [Sphingobacteriales bacterium]